MKILDNKEIMYGSVLQEYYFDDIETKKDYSFGAYFIVAIANSPELEFNELVSSSESDIGEKYEILVENDIEKVSNISWLDEKIKLMQIKNWEITTQDKEGDEIVFSGKTDELSIWTDKPDNSTFNDEEFLIKLEKYINSNL